MKIKYYFILLALSLPLFQNYASSRLIDSCKAESSIFELFKTKNVIDIARKANDNHRYDFEMEIADALGERGINASESYNLAVKKELEIP